MKDPTRQEYERIGWRYACPCGERLASVDSRSKWGMFRCASGHGWWKQYGEWEYRGTASEEPDPVLEEEARQDEWNEREREQVWGL